MHRVVSFAIVGPHELEVAFEDGVVRRINFLPVLEGELFGPLKDLDVFNEVALSPRGLHAALAERRGLRPGHLARLAGGGRRFHRDGTILGHRFKNSRRLSY